MTLESVHSKILTTKTNAQNKNFTKYVQDTMHVDMKVSSFSTTHFLDYFNFLFFSWSPSRKNKQDWKTLVNFEFSKLPITYTSIKNRDTAVIKVPLP